MSSAGLDTNILIDPPKDLPDDSFGSSIISLAELHSGVELATDVATRAQRQQRLVQLRALFDWIPFDEYSAESYGVLAATVARTRPGHARSKDIMIAGQAHALGVPLMTRNARDFELVSHLVQVIPVS
ncbi:hypothetical protein B7R21_15475 [Subtercola boreus]|uniref:Uncharacterized protein n=1 Tax=Subtercola boreus TaxID=120213 RepID=A0A3E0VDF9_9MICO|nr:PIN domain-containing protein [Subtercola boreus]RFA07583.1 hypothetical protein B7R21_15475 [Subtercola boreus]